MKCSHWPRVTSHHPPALFQPRGTDFYSLVKWVLILNHNAEKLVVDGRYEKYFKEKSISYFTDPKPKAFLPENSWACPEHESSTRQIPERTQLQICVCGPRFASLGLGSCFANFLLHNINSCLSSRLFPLRGPGRVQFIHHTPTAVTRERRESSKSHLGIKLFRFCASIKYCTESLCDNWPGVELQQPGWPRHIDTKCSLPSWNLLDSMLSLWGSGRLTLSLWF